MSINEYKKEAKANVKWTTPRTGSPGGQTCGMTNKGVTLECEDINFKLSINCFRSQYQNRELAIVLFELALEEVYK